MIDKLYEMSYFEQTYGEILDTSKMYSIITEYVPITSEYSFYDFGSGFGKIVEEFSNKFKLSYGIEINKERYLVSIENSKSDSVSLIYGNFFHTHVHGPCVVFCNNLCLGNGTSKRLSMKFNKELNTGDLLLVTKPLTLVKNQPDYLYTIDCSWGESEIYLYKM